MVLLKILAIDVAIDLAALPILYLLFRKRINQYLSNIAERRFSDQEDRLDEIVEDEVL